MVGKTAACLGVEQVATVQDIAVSVLVHLVGVKAERQVEVAQLGEAQQIATPRSSPAGDVVCRTAAPVIAGWAPAI